MDEEMDLENALFPWLDDPAYDECGDYHDYEPDDNPDDHYCDEPGCNDYPDDDPDAEPW